MYALIYDDFEPSIREKEVLSVHKTRQSAESALQKRQYDLGKTVSECHTRIVWLHGKARTGKKITPDVFDTWAPGEEIPDGDQVPDGD